MKKIIIFFITLLIFVNVFALTGCTKKSLAQGDYTAAYTRPVPELTLNDRGEFVILQITDTHLTGISKGADKKTYQAVKAQLETKTYDLVMLSGDIFEGNTKRAYDKQAAVEGLSAMFLELKQPFAFVAGNNDGEILGSVEDVLSILMQNPYFVFNDYEDVAGTGNYYIRLTDSDGVEKHRLVLIDTRMRDTDKNYYPIDQNQIDFYNRNASACAEENILLSFFGHIPFDITATVVAEGESLPGDENFCKIKEFWDTMGNSNAPLYQAIKASGRCGLTASGHMHRLDAAKYYDGIAFKFTIQSGYLNKGTLSPGVAEITIIPAASTVKETYLFNTIYI